MPGEIPTTIWPNGDAHVGYIAAFEANEQPPQPVTDRRSVVINSGVYAGVVPTPMSPDDEATYFTDLANFHEALSSSTAAVEE